MNFALMVRTEINQLATRASLPAKSRRRWRQRLRPRTLRLLRRFCAVQARLRRKPRRTAPAGAFRSAAAAQAALSAEMGNSFALSIAISQGWRRPEAAGTQNKRTSSRMSFYFGAGDEARTRYLHLGKVALYQMSYARGTVVIISAHRPIVKPFAPYF